MRIDAIQEIGIDEKERLYVKPTSINFSYIYRAAMEVHWDSDNKFLYSPKPKKWSYFDWYRQIYLAAKDEYGVNLSITKNTKWTNIENDLKNKITNFYNTNI